MVNQINSSLLCWRVGFNWPLQLHSLICHIFLSTLQFDKQDLNWSLPHSKQSRASCKWLREIFTTLCVYHLMQSETAAATSPFFFYRRRNVTDGKQQSACLFESSQWLRSNWKSDRSELTVHCDCTPGPLWVTLPCKLLLPSPDSGRSGGWGRGAAREEVVGWAERRYGCSSAGPAGKVLLVTAQCRLF